MAPLTNEMPHENVAALRDAHTEEIDKHNHVIAIGARSQSLVADLIDEIGDDHLRETVADVLTHGRNADLQQISELLPGHRTEIAQRELRDMHAEMDDSQQHHRDGTARGSGNGRTLDTQLRTAPMAEDQRIVTQDVQHVHDTRHRHGPYHLVGTTQRGRERQRERLEERQRPRQPQIDQTVAHQFRTQPHQMQQVLGKEVQEGTHRQAEHQVHHQRHAHHLHQSFAQSCPDILSTKDGRTHREKLIDEEHERYQLIVQSHRRHTVVAVAAQHHGIHRTEQHHQCDLNEDRDGDDFQLMLQRTTCHSALFSVV